MAAENILADLADGSLAGPEWDAWLANNPQSAAELAIAQRVRALLLQMGAADIPIPAGFEERLMARIRADRTVLELIDLGLTGMGQALIELINVLLSLLPAPAPQPAPAMP